MKNPSIKWGSYLAATSIIMMLIIYIIDYKLLVSMWTVLVSFILMILFPVLAAKEKRAELGYLEYGQAVMTCFIVLLISTVVSMGFQNLLYNVIDTDLAVKIKETIIEQNRGRLEGSGLGEDKIDEILESIESKSYDQDFRAFLTGLFAGSAFSLIISLIIAIFVKKQRPVFFNNDTNDIEKELISDSNE